MYKIKKYFTLPDDDGGVGDAALGRPVLGHEGGEHVAHQRQPGLQGDHSHRHQLAVQSAEKYISMGEKYFSSVFFHSLT